MYKQSKSERAHATVHAESHEEGRNSSGGALHTLHTIQSRAKEERQSERSYTITLQRPLHIAYISDLVFMLGLYAVCREDGREGDIPRPNENLEY